MFSSKARGFFVRRLTYNHPFGKLRKTGMKQQAEQNTNGVAGLVLLPGDAASRFLSHRLVIARILNRSVPQCAFNEFCEMSPKKMSDACTNKHMFLRSSVI